jgi:hypothetical protein
MIRMGNGLGVTLLLLASAWTAHASETPAQGGEAPGADVAAAGAPAEVEDADRVERKAVGETGASAGEATKPPARFREAIEVRGDALGAAPAQTPVRPTEVMGVAGGAENVFRVLATLPGVTSTDEFSSRLSVRGGGPDQNLTVMDGVEIHDPYRLFGLVSAFNPETVEGFELTTGAFGAKHGDRLSSLLVIDNRSGSVSRPVSASSALSLTDSNAIIEGALPRGAGSWLLTGRRTYYDLVAERFTSSDLPSFGDVQGKLTWNLGRRTRLTLFGLLSREGTDASLSGGSHNGTFYTHTSNDLMSAALDRSFGTRGALRTLVSYYETRDDEDIDGRFRGGMRRSNTPVDEDVDFEKVIWNSGTRIRDLAFRQEASLTASRRHLLETGLEIHRIETGVAFDISGSRNEHEANGSSLRGGAGLPAQLDSRREDTRLGAWLSDRMHLGRRLEVEAGLRLDRNSLNGDIELQPRLQASLGVTAATRVRCAVGRHTQSPGYEKLVSADYFMDLSSLDALSLRNEVATHAIVGVERDLAPGMTARVEGYYKRFDRLIVGRLETPEETRARVAAYDFPQELADSVPSRPIITSNPSNDATGRAYGVDLFVARRATSAATRLTGWVAYTWGKAERTAYGRTSAFDYDRRHSLSVVGQLRLSRRIEVALTGRLASGFPTTPPVGLRVSSVPDERDADGDGNREELVPERDRVGRLVYLLDQGGVANINSAWQAAYARIDGRVTFTPRFGRERLKLYVDVINILNRKNVGMMERKLEYDPSSDRPRIVETSEGSIPFLPSFGVHYRF